MRVLLTGAAGPYALSNLLQEELCRNFHELNGLSIAGVAGSSSHSILQRFINRIAFSEAIFSHASSDSSFSSRILFM